MKLHLKLDEVVSSVDDQAKETRKIKLSFISGIEFVSKKMATFVLFPVPRDDSNWREGRDSKKLAVKSLSRLS